MSWTKEQLIEEAYSEIALAGYVFDITPDEMQTALRRLDTMMATLNGKGIRLGYPLPSSPDTSKLDQDSSLPDWAVEAVYLNLAIRLAPGNGKQLSQDTRNSAKAGYDMLMARAAMPAEQQYKPHLPIGAGNKQWRGLQNTFLPDPVDPITTGSDGQIDLY